MEWKVGDRAWVVAYEGDKRTGKWTVGARDEIESISYEANVAGETLTLRLAQNGTSIAPEFIFRLAEDAYGHCDKLNQELIEKRASAEKELAELEALRVEAQAARDVYEKKWAALQQAEANFASRHPDYERSRKSRHQAALDEAINNPFKDKEAAIKDKKYKIFLKEGQRDRQRREYGYDKDAPFHGYAKDYDDYK
jgi:hypothetical protein